MNVSVSLSKKDVNQIKSKLKKIKKKITNKRLMAAALIKVRDNILFRTNAGKDVNYSSFKPYSPLYAKEEGKTIVNLTKTETMLGAMTTKVLSKTKGKIFFLNAGYKDSDLTARDVARMHNFGKGVPKREFFGVNERDSEIAAKEYKKAIDKAMKEKL